MDRSSKPAMQITHDNGWGRTYVFTVVEGFPNSSYCVWNIGDNMNEGYLPLCLRAPNREDWQMNVNPDNLCAIDMRDNPDLLAKFRWAARWGINNYETALAASQKKPVLTKQSSCAYVNREMFEYDYASQKQAIAEELVGLFEELSAGFLNPGRS